MRNGNAKSIGRVLQRLTVVVFTFFLAGCSSLPDRLEHHYSRKLARLPNQHKQAIIVTPMGGADAVVSSWEKQDHVWVPVFDPMPAVVGSKGIALAEQKREGDGRTPSGIFDLKIAFGYALAIETKLRYRQATESDLWIDDVKAPDYNQWVKSPTRAASYERMKRPDDLYKLGAVIEYNTQPVVPRWGSAIFLHIWKGPHQPTSGCVALDEGDLSDLLKWLDVQKSPVIVIQTRWEIL